MNFIKKVFFSSNKQTPKTQSTITKSQNQQAQQQIPLQVLSQLFQKSAKYISQSSKTISDQNKLIIYGLYKQATIGDCNTPKPSMMDFVGKSKWNAWNTNMDMSKSQAMKAYISKAVQIDPQIQKKMQTFFEQGNQLSHQQNKQKQKNQSAVQSTIGLKMVQQKDYSNSYSNQYFRLIQKDLPIQKINKEILLVKNNNPKCYPLHFAIDKQRIATVRQFLQILSVDQIKEMKDEDGTGIQEYAELIQNQEIIKMVKQKLGTL